MKIGGITPHSLCDYPGHTAAVFFTQGCPWRCPYCHNPKLVLPECFDTPVSQRRITSFLERRQGKLDGIVVSGGEPTVHEDLMDFLRLIKSYGYLVKLDTNGSRPEVINEAIRAQLVDYIAMDVKATASLYSMATGRAVDVSKIRESIRLIKLSGIPHEFRTTVVPGLHTARELKEIGRMVEGADRFALQEFIAEDCLRPEYRNRQAFPKESLVPVIANIRKRVPNVELRYSEDAALRYMPPPIEETPAGEYLRAG